MLSYALTAWLLINGQLHVATLDHDLSLRECMDMARRTTSARLDVLSESEVVPLECVPEYQT